MAKKIIGCTVALALIGAGVVATIMISKKTRKKAIALVETVIDEADDMIQKY